MSKYIISGNITIVVDPHTMETVVTPFEFKTKYMMTRNNVLKEALLHISDHYIVHGVKSVDYKINLR